VLFRHFVPETKATITGRKSQTGGFVLYIKVNLIPAQMNPNPKRNSCRDKNQKGTAGRKPRKELQGENVDDAAGECWESMCCFSCV